MNDPYAVGRRRFLKTAAVAAAATGVACGKADSRWRRLTEPEAATLAAACDQIIPPDQAAPGAADAGVITFIDRQLATRSRKDLPFWQSGVAGLDATARRRHGAPFAQVGAAAQAAILQDTEAGKVDKADWNGAEPGEFFGRLRQYTMMGYYGDPRHGGNRERVGWRTIGVPDPPVRGRLHETPPPPALAPRPTPVIPADTLRRSKT
jgi:gluconate 2-dehydrogenase gamma chain